MKGFSEFHFRNFSRLFRTNLFMSLKIIILYKAQLLLKSDRSF